jgi:lambda family phage portal protein
MWPFTAKRTEPQPIKKRRYEAAQTNRYTTNHFLYAGGADANTEISSALSTLRQRCRYEMRNSGLLRGMADTLAADLVGPEGPRLQIASPGGEDLELAWQQWAAMPDRTGRLSLADMLRLTIYQLIECGEAIFHEAWGPDGYTLLMIEPDRLASPGGMLTPDESMGVKMDPTTGKPTAYYIAKQHPGSSFQSLANQYELIPADQIIHIFRVDRPGQTRGVPWATPSLLTLANYRRYDDATLKAAEKAASISAVMKSTSPDIEGMPNEDYDEIEISPDVIMTLPAGWDINQIRAEHPSVMYDSFRKGCISSIARPFNMPFNVAAADSSGYNYASGRLDHQPYHRFIACVRAFISRVFLDRTFDNWYALERNRYTGKAMPIVDLKEIGRSWFWPGFEDSDPEKEAKAEQIRLEAKTISRRDIFAKRGQDWRDKLNEMAEEQAYAESIGLDLNTARPTPPQPTGQGDTPNEKDAGADDTTDDPASDPEGEPKE